MWSNVDKIILRIEPWIHFYSKTTYLYASQYCSKEYEYCLLQYSRFMKELVQTKKKIRIPYGCKSHCKSINERFSKLEDCLQSRIFFKRKYVHHLSMKYYLHKELLQWKVSLFFIPWNRTISVIIILDVS